MRYVLAKYKDYMETKAYRFYIADSLYYQPDGMRLRVKYAEIIKPQKIDIRTGDEIALDVITRLGLKVN